MDNLGKTDLDIQDSQDTQDTQESHGLSYEDMLPKNENGSGKPESSEPSNWEQILSGFYEGEGGGDGDGGNDKPVVDSDSSGQGELNSFDDFKDLNIAPTETAYQLKPIKKKSFAPVVAIIAVLVIGIAGLFAYLLMNDMLPFSSGDPATLYKKAETKYLNSLVKESEKLTAEDAAYDYSLVIKPGGALNQFMELNPTTLSGKVNLKDGKYYYDFAVANGTNKYLEMQTWMTESDIMLLLPALSDIYVSYSLGGGAMSANSVDYSAFFESIGDKITEYYFDELGEITVEKGRTGSIGSTEYTYDVLNVQIPAELLIKMAQTFIDVLKEDPAFAQYASEIGDINMSDIDTQDEYLNMTVYLNKNEIMGRSFSVSGTRSNIDIGYISGGKSGKSFTMWANIFDGEQTVKLSLDNECTENGDKLSGMVKGSLNAGSFAKYSFSVEYTDLEFDKNGGVTGGVMKISIPELPLTADVTVSTSGKTTTTVTDVWYSGMSVCTLESSVEQLTPEAVTIPETNDRVVIVDGNGSVVSGNYELAEQFSVEVQTGIMSILDKAVVDGKYDLISFALQMAMSSMTGMYTSSIDYSADDYIYGDDMEIYDWSTDIDWDDYDISGDWSADINWDDIA